MIKDIMKTILFSYATIFEFLFQPVYTIMVISMLLIIQRLSPKLAIGFLLIYIIHFASIYVFGFYKGHFGQEKLCRKYFVIVSVCLFIATALLCGLSALIVIIPIMIAGFWAYFGENLICFTVTKYSERPILERIFEKHPAFYGILILAIPMIIFIVSLLVSTLPWGVKTAILISMLVAIPFIALGADDEMSFDQILTIWDE